VNDPAIINASVGICYKDLAADKIIISENLNKSLIPASTMKLFTSYAALNILGADYRFKTLLQYDGYLDEAGNLHGNVYIRGGGDPTFGSNRYGKRYQTDSIFYKFMKALNSIGIRNIEGDVIGDGSVFGTDMVPYTWSWADVGNYYGAGVSGLNIYENEYSLTFRPADSIGKKALLVKTDPTVPGLELINYVTTKADGGKYDIYVLGSPYETKKRVEGAIAISDNSETIRGSIPDPEYFTAYQFYQYLLKNKFIMNGKAAGMRQLNEEHVVVNQNRKTLYTHESPALTDIIKLLNTFSINLYAEAMLKMMGSVKYGSGTYESGTKAVRDYLTNNKIDVRGFKMFDGSGMTRANTFTPKQMSELLTLIHKGKSYQSFTGSFPVSGVSGTLSKFGGGTSLENNFRAKTGSMYNVKAYAGYLKNSSGKWYSVVIMVNNFTCSNAQLQDKIEKMLVKLAESKED
jgi:D-alanyl-D-alanine carboxypeptidase/D-alanyl-D-alanine-endopeptidase (penicillin-binding protein 4)